MGQNKNKIKKQYEFELPSALELQDSKVELKNIINDN